MVANPIKQKRYSLEEYFALEEKATEKHEFHNGKIITMPGGSIPHNKIAVNITSFLDNLFEEKELPYFVLNSDTKVRIEKFNRIVYPDALIICEKIEYWDGRTDTVLNPKLIFEVSSDSTEEYDKEDKFLFYRSLGAFKEYVRVDQYKPSVVSYFKQDEEEDLWKITSKIDIKDSLFLKSIGFDLPLEKIYRQIPKLQGEKWEG